MMKRTLALFSLTAFLLPISSAQSPFVPSIMQQGYVTTDAAGRKLEVKFRVERGRVSVDQAYWNGRTDTIEIGLADIVGLSMTPPLPWGKWSLDVRQNREGERIIIFNSKEDCVAVGKYLSETSGIRLEQTGATSTTPTPSSQYVPSSQPGPLFQPPPPPSTAAAATSFSCPPSTAIACSDFKELVSHNDPEIVGYMKRKDEFVLGCFSTEGEHKFTVLDANLPSKASKSGILAVVNFENGVQKDYSLFWLKWVSDALTSISEARSQQSSIGTITESEFQMEQTFKNILGTFTQRKTAIRWSTGKYVQQGHARDEKGKFQSFSEEGSCTPLN